VRKEKSKTKSNDWSCDILTLPRFDFSKVLTFGKVNTNSFENNLVLHSWNQLTAYGKIGSRGNSHINHFTLE